jgi:hypothetical protein
MTTSILAIAALDTDDDALVARLSDHGAEHITILLERDDAGPSWWEDPTPEARSHRNRLAVLLARVEAATGAAVSGRVGDRSAVANLRYSEIVRTEEPVLA